MKPISEKTFIVLEEYSAFLFHSSTMKITNAVGYERERVQLHQQLFRTMNGDRIRHRDTPVGKRLESLQADVFACPICMTSVDREWKCFNCRRLFTRQDITLNVNFLRTRQERGEEIGT